MTDQMQQLKQEALARWRAKVRAEYGPGADDLTPEEEREYDRERQRVRERTITDRNTQR